MSCASSSSKQKRKENQYKIRKIKEKKNKIVSVQVSHNTWIVVLYIILVDLHWTHYKLSIPLKGPTKILLDQYPLWF